MVDSLKSNLRALTVAGLSMIAVAAEQAGQVTVATNMAGHGTDIQLGATVANSSGLHV